MQGRPEYSQLVRERSRWTWTILAIILVAYACLMLAIAFRPDWLRIPLAPGAVLTIGWPLAVGAIVVVWLLMGLYVLRANSRFETLKEALLADASANLPLLVLSMSPTAASGRAASARPFRPCSSVPRPALASPRP